jgi:hypothetical protein
MIFVEVRVADVCSILRFHCATVICGRSLDMLTQSTEYSMSTHTYERSRVRTMAANEASANKSATHNGSMAPPPPVDAVLPRPVA